MKLESHKFLEGAIMQLERLSIKEDFKEEEDEKEE